VLQIRSVRARCRLGFVLAGVAIVALLGPVGAPPPAPQQANAGTVPPGFEDTVVIGGLINPTVIRFASDGRVFVAEKRGVIKVYDSLFDPTPAVFADLRTNVYNFWDRGLLGMALDPGFPSNPYVYVLYSYDHELGSTSPPPRWGTPGTDSDPCPTPPGPNTDGCVISARLSRLIASGNTMSGSEKVLIEDWCQQYPSHSIGALQFGPDGQLYVSAGDGASFTFTDYGQDGNPLNPCGDPPGGAGSALAPPTAEGGALRSQDLRATGDPVTLDGAILRVDPSTGAAAPGNPLAANPDPNAQRIIAYGLRNPFRFAFRPGTSELWVGDVGWNTWEEIDRVMNPTDSVVENFGWPCYEGQGRQTSYDSANLNICENLYGTPSADTKPYFTYNHANPVVPGESCTTGSSSISGLSFEFSPTGGSFPTPYQGALFFADYSRNCIWAMKKGANGVPAPGLVETFVAGAAHPVDLEFGPGGALFYVDIDGGTVHRVAYVAGRPDLALGRPAAASSSESSSVTPDKANDGDSTTRWSSGFANGQWWQVDLGATNQVDTVSLNWEAAYASSYKLQVSTDGSTFTDAATVSTNAPGWKTTTFAPVSARYVRVLGVTRATQWGISLWDAQVFGSTGNGAPVNTSPPVISGFAGQGQALSTTTGAWSGSPTSYTYQWQRCDSSGASCQPASPAATGQTYVLTAGDVGRTVRVTVTASNGGGVSQPASSAVTGVVRADLGLARPAAASSSESSSRTPDKANDGDSTTRWSSGFADGQWWQVDLGSTRQVDTMSLNWEAAYASSYKIQVSTDGSTFADAATVSNNAPGWKTTTFTPVSARYVRVLGVTRATQWGISFWDAQVFGGAGPANSPPKPVIDAPLPTLTWKVGDPISFTGHATDPEQGTLPASALSWTLLIQHCPSSCHPHTIQTWPGVASGSFNAPDHDYPSWLELGLTATDAGGASATASVLLHPITVALTFASSPSSLQIAVDGASVTTPATLQKIVGSTTSMSATTPQVFNGTAYEFVSWSDGGAQTHNVTVPSSHATFTATYQVVPIAPPTNTALPVISGSGPPREGRQLTVSNGTWTGSQPMTFTYQWSRCDSSGGACVGLTGATSKTYTPTSSDVGSRLRATVTATNAGGVASATSNPTSAIRSR
jgi:glucose/arabinose dehydrogenase